MSIIRLRSRIREAFETLKAKEGLCCSIIGNWNPLLETDVFIQVSQVTDVFTHTSPRECKAIIHLPHIDGSTGDICPFCNRYYINPDLYTRVDYIGHFKIVDGVVSVIEAAAIPLWMHTKVRDTIQAAV